MEELLVILFQFLFELLAQVLAEVPWGWFIGSRPATERESGPVTWAALSLVAGVALGGLSLLKFPTTLLHWPSARLANLAVAPAVSALVSFHLAQAKSKRTGTGTDPKVRATCAACFTFGLAAIRFTFAVRPHH